LSLPPGLEFSAFDTEAFGVPCYKLVDPAQEGLSWLAQRSRNEPLFATCKIACGGPSHSQALHSAGFIAICTQIRLTARIDGHPESPAPAISLDFDDQEVDGHAGNFRHDRLSQDTRIPAEWRLRYYRSWLRNSKGRGILVARHGSAICTLRLTPPSSTIELMSSLVPGRGEARAALENAIGLARRHSCTEISVTTEAENIPALKLYTTAGLAPVESLRVHHLLGAKAQGTRT
jgi:hypothetical protein